MTPTPTPTEQPAPKPAVVVTKAPTKPATKIDAFIASLQTWLNQKFQLPPNRDYQKGYNDCLLDLKNHVAKLAAPTTSVPVKVTTP